MRGDLWRRLKLPWQRRIDLEREIDEELAFHMEMREQELVDGGMDPMRARATVATQFGDIGRTRARYVSQRSRRQRRDRSRLRIEELAQDLRFGARTLRRYPSFSAAAILVLALGIGASTTVFTLVDTIFFERPAHVVEPDRLVRLFRASGPGQGGGSLQHPDYVHYRDNASTLSGLAAYGGRVVAAYRIDGGAPDQLEVLHTTEDYFEVLGVRPAHGRTFTTEENDAPNESPVAILSHGFWLRAFGGDPAAVGRTLSLNGHPFTVVGVAPEGFEGLTPLESAPDVWVPTSMFGVLTGQARTAWWERVPSIRQNWLSSVGRLASGVTFEAARANLEGLSDALDYDGKPAEESLLLTRQFLYRPDQEASLTSLSLVLLGVVGIVLAITIANVAVLLLSRASTRRREIGVRAAIGAGRRRLVRQLLVESLVLGAVGGAFGMVLAFLFAGFAASLLPLPFTVEFRPDGWVLAAAAGLSVLASLLVGLAPAIHGTRADLRSVMGSAAAPAGGARARNSLVVSQVALSLVLVAGALLFASSFRAARSLDLGFRSDDLLVLQVSLRGTGHTPDEGRAFVRSALDRLSNLPGVRGVTTSAMVPFQGDWSTRFTAPPDAAANAEDGEIYTGMNSVGPGYFDVAGIDIVRGRPLGPDDDDASAPVIVINERLAETLWPGQEALGRGLGITNEETYTVVGVARDATYYTLGEEPATQTYASIYQYYDPTIHFYVRTDGAPAALARAAQDALREIEPVLTFGWVTTMASVVEDQTARYEVTAVLVGLLSLIALALAAAGLYGVVGFLVAQRTREIGVRMALGANRARVALQVLLAGLRLAALGVAIGLLGTLWLRRFTESLVFAVEPGDSSLLVVASLALLGVTALASAGPARRATRVDPMSAMRAE
jgi:predicted permease